MARSFSAASSEYLQYGGAVLAGFPCTLAAWFYLLDVSDYYGILEIGDPDVTNARWAAIWSGKSSSEYLYAQTRKGATSGLATSSAKITAGAWHHAVGTFTGWSARSVYLDGGNSGNNSTSVPSFTPDTTTIGAFTGSGIDFHINGYVAEAAVWNAVLGTDEIAALAHGCRPASIRPQGLVAYWPLGGLCGRNDRDHWKNGYHMTAYNTPGWAEHPGILYGGRPRVGTPAKTAHLPWHLFFGRAA